MMCLRKLLAVALLGATIVTGAFAEAKVLGKLGQVKIESKIYSRPKSNSPVYYKVEAKAYLVVKPISSSWYQVLLQNGAYGYIHAQNVERLPYEVTQDQQKPRNVDRSVTYASRSRGGIVPPATAAAVAQFATKFEGTPYVWGGTDPNRGIDCSGLVQNMFGRIGLNLPRTAAEQVKVGMAITRLEDLRAGDRLYFWDAKRGKVGHTGIYLGNGRFVHSSSTHKGVATDYLGEKRWMRILVAARRS